MQEDCSVLNSPECDTQLWSSTQISLFEATKYDQNELISLAEIFSMRVPVVSLQADV